MELVRNPQLSSPGRPIGAHPHQDRAGFGDPPRPARSAARSTTRCASGSASTRRSRRTPTSQSSATPPTSSPISARCRPTRSWRSRRCGRRWPTQCPTRRSTRRSISARATSDQEHHAEDLPELHRQVLALQDRSRQGASRCWPRPAIPNGFDMTISYDKAIAEMEEACTLIKSSFDKIGINVKLEGLPSAVYSETKFQRKQMAHCDNFQWPWIADTGYTAWVYLTHPEDQRDGRGPTRQSGAQRADRDDVHHAPTAPSGPRWTSGSRRWRPSRCRGSSW